MLKVSLVDKLIALFICSENSFIKVLVLPDDKLNKFSNEPLQVLGDFILVTLFSHKPILYLDLILLYLNVRKRELDRVAVSDVEYLA